jgi:hypothetical protein
MPLLSQQLLTKGRPRRPLAIWGGNRARHMDSLDGGGLGSPTEPTGGLPRALFLCSALATLVVVDIVAAAP